MSLNLTALKRWEELGQQLEKTTSEFLDACAALDLPASSYSLNTKDLIRKIDDRIISIDDRIISRVGRARSILGHTRNKLAAPILCLPDETLSKILHLALVPTGGQTTQNRVNSYYHDLHALLGVCSVWRRVILASRILWSIIPIVRQPNGRYTSTAAKVSLERSAGCKLQLIAELFTDKPDMLDFVLGLSRYGLDLRSIWIEADGIMLIREFFLSLIRCGNSYPNLTSLHIILCSPLGLSSTLPLLDIPDIEVFNRILGSLHVIQLCNVDDNFAGLSLKSVTELRLRDLQLTSSIKFEELLWALSASSQLQILELRTITAPHAVTTTPHNFPILLPKLKFLYLIDLYQNTLNVALASIQQESHKVYLVPTNKCLEVLHPGGIEAVGAHGLEFQNVRIDGLVLLPSFTADTGDLLELLPTVTTLFIHSCRLTADYLHQLTRPKHPASRFPQITTLQILNSGILASDVGPLRDMVANHPVKILGLGINVTGSTSYSDEASWNPLQHDGLLVPIRDWLSDNVPRVTWQLSNYPIASAIMLVAPWDYEI